MDLHVRRWHLYEDTELHLVHSRRACPAAKIADKYNYLEPVTLKEGDLDSAERLDARAKPCPSCQKHEHRLFDRLAGHVPPPGFRAGLPHKPARRFRGKSKERGS